MNIVSSDGDDHDNSDELEFQLLIAFEIYSILIYGRIFYLDELIDVAIYCSFEPRLLLIRSHCSRTTFTIRNILNIVILDVSTGIPNTEMAKC